MLPAIFRAIAEAAGGGEAAAEEASLAKQAVVPFRKLPRAAVQKPNKIIRIKPKVPGVVARTAGKVPTTGAMASRPRIRVTPSKPKVEPQPGKSNPFEDASNATPPDTSTSDKHSRDTVQDKTEQLTPQAAPETPEASVNVTETLTRLFAAQQLVQAASSSVIPKCTWACSISARGYKGTPLRTVLHYCLAVVFGTIHYQRLGNTTMKVDLHPMENMVDISFGVNSTMVFEPVNVGFAWIKSKLEAIVEDAREIGSSESLGAGIQKFIDNNLNPDKAVADFTKRIGDISRLTGPAGIYDMARRDYFAGEPPATMLIEKVQPYTEMVEESTEDHLPFLTRSLAMNPQGDRFTDMHYPTFTDLRSLVAQALYDPGVLPPSPDTFVALPDRFME